MRAGERSSTGEQRRRQASQEQSAGTCRQARARGHEQALTQEWGRLGWARRWADAAQALAAGGRGRRTAHGGVPERAGGVCRR
jgi:hypothetical protein